MQYLLARAILTNPSRGRCEYSASEPCALRNLILNVHAIPFHWKILCGKIDESTPELTESLD